MIDDRPTFPLEHLLDLRGGRLVEWEAVGDGEPLLWIEGGPGLPAHLARPDVELITTSVGGARLVEFPGVGHVPQYEAAAGVRRVVLDFPEAT